MLAVSCCLEKRKSMDDDPVTSIIGRQKVQELLGGKSGCSTMQKTDIVQKYRKRRMTLSRQWSAGRKYRSTEGLTDEAAKSVKCGQGSQVHPHCVNCCMIADCWYTEHSKRKTGSQLNHVTCIAKLGCWGLVCQDVLELCVSSQSFVLNLCS